MQQIDGTLGHQPAQFFYVDNYRVSISDDQLTQLAKSFFTTHQTVEGEAYHQRSQFVLIPWRKALQFIGSAFQPCPGANKEEETLMRSVPVRLLVGAAGLAGLFFSGAIAALTGHVHLQALLHFKDNQRMGLAPDALEEPSGSWYTGPFAQPDTLLAVNVMKYIEKDKLDHDYQTPKVNEIKVKSKVKWGTKDWWCTQTANTARFDYILVPKHSGECVLKGRVEIRRVAVPEGTQSAPTDHLPVDAEIWKTV